MASVKEEIITPDSPSPGARLSFTPDIFSASSCGRWPPAGRLFMPELGLFKPRQICYTKYLGKHLPAGREVKHEKAAGLLEGL